MIGATEKGEGMKRILILAVLALGLSVAFVPTASSQGVGDAQGPPCANITNGDGGYSFAGVVDFTVFLQAPACSFVTYSFFVTDTSGTLLGSSSTWDSNCTAETEGGGCVHFIIDLGSSGPSTVCVYATTDIHGHIADLAPNPPASFCLTKGAGGATGPFG
jgi:hypothetical protein